MENLSSLRRGGCGDSGKSRDEASIILAKTDESSTVSQALWCWPVPHSINLAWIGFHFIFAEGKAQKSNSSLHEVALGLLQLEIGLRQSLEESSQSLEMLAKALTKHNDVVEVY